MTDPVPSPAPGDWSFPPMVAETHISVLFFVGDRVYKLKKPVSFGFLDFSTPSARRAACHREVELNRRLAPDVYLGVLDLAGFDGAPCDHVVVMRRMPPERRLAALVQAGADLEEELERIARRVAAFHAAAPMSTEIAEAGSVEAVRRHWDASFEEIGAFIGPVLDASECARVEEVVHRYVSGRERGGDPSDATAEVAAAMAARADPWPGAVAVDTAGDPVAALEQAMAALSGLNDDLAVEGVVHREDQWRALADDGQASDRTLRQQFEAFVFGNLAELDVGPHGSSSSTGPGFQHDGPNPINTIAVSPLTVGPDVTIHGTRHGGQCPWR